MERYETLTQVLRDARNRDRQIRFIDGDKDESCIQFPELWEEAVNLLGDLQQLGMGPGDELVIFTHSNRRFLIAFWAAVLGGIVPVPVAVGISDEHRFKLFRIIGQMQRGTLFTEAELLGRLLAFAQQHNLSDIKAILETRSQTYGSVNPDILGDVIETTADDIAFIQYSSGSTSDPKGICLTHRNLMTNILSVIDNLKWHDEEVSLSWMPLTHDMGLIGYHLTAFASGMQHSIMDTNLFVRRPLLWISKASELKATQLCSPNFGYKHFLKLFARKGLTDVDLSPVRLILNGAEPISWELCEAFLEALAPFGLKRSTMFPVYGLAEATVAVSFPPQGSEMTRLTADRHQLRIGEPVVRLKPGDRDAISFVACGRAIRDVEIRIVDDNDSDLADERVGHIQLRGGSVTAGLYNNDDAEADMFTADGWLRTGDCGLFSAGNLYITGRSKDIIIVNGQNYYPHDIEEVVATLDELDLGKVAVAGVSTGGDGEELLVFVLYRKDTEAFRQIAADIRDLIGERLGLEVDHVLPVNRIPKTTSGKVQRAHLARDYEAGEFTAIAAALGTTVEPGDDNGLDDDPVVRELELICRAFSKDRLIGPDENLFEVGVSSLTLTEIVLAVEDKYPGKVDISDLFDYPTIRELADFIRR